MLRECSELAAKLKRGEKDIRALAKAAEVGLGSGARMRWLRAPTTTQPHLPVHCSHTPLPLPQTLLS
jgi:hypothetical protein